MNYIDNIMTLENFLSMIIRFQNDYFLLDDCLEKGGITAKEIACIYRMKSHIAEEVSRFILNRNTSVIIFDNKSTEQGHMKV